MTHVETKVSLSRSQNGMNLKELEQEIGKTLQQAGQQLLLQACQVLENQLMEQEKSKYLRDKRRQLHILNRFGWIRLPRWQARKKEGGHCRPLDELLGLAPRQHASP